MRARLIGRGCSAATLCGRSTAAWRWVPRSAFWRPTGDCAHAASDAAPMMASSIRHRLAGEIRAVSARANRDMKRPPNDPEFRWAMRAEPCRNESAPEAAAVSGLAVAIPPHWLVLNRDRLVGEARYDAPDHWAHLRLNLARLGVAPREPRELAPIEPPPAGFQAGEKVELPLCQRAHHEPDPVARAASSADEASHRLDVGAAG